MNSVYICGGQIYNGYSSACWRIYYGKICNGKYDFEDGVCSNNGICENYDSCVCKDGYYGTNCEFSKCEGILSNETGVCTGRGLCVDSKCLCYFQSTFNNPDCSVNENLEQFVENLWIYITVPIGFVIFILLLTICVIAVTYLFLKLRKTKKKFDGIEDIDIILSEAKLEQQRINPKIDVQKSLFEIEYKDLELISILGDGGSQTTIFLTLWEGNYCAYKSFRSKNILSNESTFKDFEREVKIYSSINHPSILQFYGACVNPPKVGILLQYCKKGDLQKFLSNYKISYHRKYDVVHINNIVQNNIDINNIVQNNM